MSEKPRKKETLLKKTTKIALFGALILVAAHALIAGGTAISGELHKIPKPV
ncbi:MAG: hypothetical protein ACE5DX_02475 [Candidatus Dojkabacteria bacterium]